MAGYKIQLKDKNGNKQYPVSTTNTVVDADGVSVADLLDRKQPTLVSGVNIKTINGKTLLGEGDLVIEGGTADLSGYATTEYVDAKVGESYPVYYSQDGTPLTEEQKAANKEAYDAVVAAWDADAPQMPYLYPYDLGKQFPLIVFDFSAEEGLVGLLLNIDLMPAPLSDYGIPLLATGLISESAGLNLYSDGRITIEYGKVYISPDISAMQELAKGSGGSGETAESDVICVVWDDDTSDIPSNKEAYQKLAECCETVGKPAAVMVCVETGYRWGIEHFYWKTRFEDIELVTPVRNDGMYAIFTLTSDGVCTADFKQVSLGGGGGGSDSSNVVSFYMPLMDDSGEVVTYEDCINEITTRFADSISQEVIDAITSHFQSMIDHNVASFAELEERLRNGEKPLIVMRGFTYWLFLLMIYLWAVNEGRGMDITDEELIAELDLLANAYEVIYPESYIMDFDEGSGAYLEVNVEDIGVSIGANGNWEKQSETDVRKSATLYYEGAARLTAKECETNLKSKGYWLNNCDFQVSRYNGDGWSDNEDVLIIGKSTKTVSDFVNLNGDVVTCGVTAFQYIEDTQLIELQVSNEDGYCRRVVLGKVNVGENGGGSNITETDPVFTASAAAKITDANITAWNNKVDKVSGKGLSTNDYTTTEKNKLAGIAEGAEVNVQSDWNATSGDAYIKNKPTIPAAVTESTVSGWGFTKNTGTYSKPSTGIPKSDLASSVQTSLGKADTALQSYTEQYKGTVTGVKVNDSVKSPSNGVVDLGTIPTTIDTSMSDTSTNPVRNKTIKAYVDSKAATAGQIAVVAHGYNDTSVEITPNVYHRWTYDMSSLTITLQSVSSAYVLNYMFEFTASVSGCVLTLPTNIKWANGNPPAIKPNATYQISIVNNLGVWTCYE